MARFLINIITLYQKTLSPDHSWLADHFPDGYCRYNPTCSEYTKQALEIYGTVKGAWLGLKRLLRCNPLASFGNDPVPKIKLKRKTQNYN